MNCNISNGSKKSPIVANMTQSTESGLKDGDFAKLAANAAVLGLALSQTGGVGHKAT